MDEALHRLAGTTLDIPHVERRAADHSANIESRIVATANVLSNCLTFVCSGVVRIPVHLVLDPSVGQFQPSAQRLTRRPMQLFFDEPVIRVIPASSDTQIW